MSRPETGQSILQRITAIQREHQWRKYDDRCRCGDPGTYDEHPEHVTAVLAEDLGLTEEVATVPELVGRVEHTQPCAVPGHMIASEDWHTCGYHRGHFEFPQKSRWVTRWEPADG